MAADSRHVSVRISRPADDVYRYVSDPSRLPEWAAGLTGSVSYTGRQWVADSPMGRIVIAFAPPNEFGVADHWVTDPSGQTFYNPMRVVQDGDGAEVIFTVRRADGTSDEDFRRDAEAVQADLAGLKRRLEAG
jgi:Polyketide cyclase / dehydrase and lipid transport